jgi:hypothetical protein
MVELRLIEDARDAATRNRSIGRDNTADLLTRLCAALEARDPEAEWPTKFLATALKREMIPFYELDAAGAKAVLRFKYQAEASQFVEALQDWLNAATAAPSSPSARDVVPTGGGQVRDFDEVPSLHHVVTEHFANAAPTGNICAKCETVFLPGDPVLRCATEGCPVKSAKDIGDAAVEKWHAKHPAPDATPAQEGLEQRAHELLVATRFLKEPEIATARANLLVALSAEWKRQRGNGARRASPAEGGGE